MNSHLNENAMLRWYAGEASELERAHIAECAECQARTQPLADALSCFGVAARHWGAEKAETFRRMQVVAGAVHRGYRFAAVAALACLLLFATGAVLLLSQKNASAPAQAHATQRQETQQDLVSDNALLDEVDQDVSREVPSALQPLSWSASDTTTRQ